MFPSQARVRAYALERLLNRTTSPCLLPQSKTLAQRHYECRCCEGFASTFKGFFPRLSALFVSDSACLTLEVAVSLVLLWSPCPAVGVSLRLSTSFRVLLTVLWFLCKMKSQICFISERLTFMTKPAVERRSQSRLRRQL